MSAMDQVLAIITPTNISLSLAIIGLGLSTWSATRNLKSARKLEEITKDTKVITGNLDDVTKNTKTITDAVHVIKGGISTKYIDEYPGYMSEVASLISRAKRNIFITHVLQTKSTFTDYNAWLKYKQEIEQAQALRSGRDLKISAVFSNQPRQREFLEAQFATEKQDWDRWRSNEVNRLKLKTFIQFFGDKESGEYNDNNISFEQFMGIFAETNRIATKELFCRAQVFEVDFRPQIFSWIIDDGAEAIFVVPVLKPVFTAHAFSTTDHSFTKNVMIPLHEEHCRSGRQISPNEV